MVIDTSTPFEPTVPRSKVPAQKSPAETDAESCGVLPPEVVTLLVMSQPPMDVPGMPMPSPTAVAGAVLFNVTVTVPAADAVNVRTAEPPGAITALNDSVPGPAGGGVGDVDVGVLSLPQAVQSSAITSASSAGRVMRLVKNPLL